VTFTTNLETDVRDRLHHASELGKRHAEACAVTVSAADRSRREALLEHAAERLTQALANVHARMRSTGASALDIREHGDAVQIVYADKLSALLTDSTPSGFVDRSSHF
jgi:hypothetical protein